MGEYNDNENDNEENATQKLAERQEHVKDYNKLIVWIMQNVFSSSNMTMRDCLPVATSIKNQHLYISEGASSSVLQRSYYCVQKRGDWSPLSYISF